MRIGIVVLSCSLLLGLLAAQAVAIDYAGLQKRMAAGNTAQDLKVAREVYDDPNSDEAISLIADEAVSTAGATRKAALRRLAAAVELRAQAQAATRLGKTDEVRNLAERAKNSPLFRDPSETKRSNWVGKGLEGLNRFRLPEAHIDPNLPRLGGLPYFLIYVMWALLGGLLLFLAFLALRHFSWKRNLTRKAKALLEEDEPERTLDEWLEMADRLTGEGRFREAVRCLYLACLLKFDERLVARFDRGQTNWEHLTRIESSPKLPMGLDFRVPTKRFDTIWYGQRTRGMADVEQFREFYGRVSQTLAEVKA